MNLKDKIQQIKIRKLNRKVFQFPNKLTLYKDDKYKNINIDISECLISASNKKDVEKLKEKIKNFLIVMKTNCNNFDEIIFIENFKKTYFDISKVKKGLFYDVSNIIIYENLYIFTIYSFDAIYHELMHLASIKATSCPNKLMFLNEGYTQLLTERYFGIIDNCSIYPFEVIFMRQIENILGRHFLEDAYFKNNFNNALINLQNYISEQEYNFLLFYIKKLYTIEQNNEHWTKHEDTQSLINKISRILFKITIKKLDSIKETEEKIKFFNSSKYLFTEIFFTYEGKKVAYKLYDEKTINEYLDNVKTKQKNKRN